MEEKQNSKEEAAITIQKLQRGKKARAQHKVKKMKAKENKAKAATKIQKIHRGNSTREKSRIKKKAKRGDSLANAKAVAAVTAEGGIDEKKGREAEKKG